MSDEDRVKRKDMDTLSAKCVCYFPIRFHRFHEAGELRFVAYVDWVHKKLMLMKNEEMPHLKPG